MLQKIIFSTYLESQYIMLFQVDVVRDSLYDLNEFVSLRAPLVRSEVVPDLEIQLLQLLAKKMLSAQHNRCSMNKVSHSCRLIKEYCIL